MSASIGFHHARRSVRAPFRSSHRHRRLRFQSTTAATTVVHPQPAHFPDAVPMPPLADLSQVCAHNRRWLSSVAAATESVAASPTDPPAAPLDVFAGTDLDMAGLKRLADKTPTPLRLQNMYKYGRGIDEEQRIRNAVFLHQELPLRIAQRAYDLLTLPYGLSESEPIREVAQAYIGYIQIFRDLPAPQNQELEDQFTDAVQSVVVDRSKVPESIFRGIQAWMHKNEAKPCQLEEMEAALYRFFTARVGLRFLAEHHVLSSRRLRESTQVLRSKTLMFPPEEEQSLGCIQTNLDPVQEVQQVADLVRQQTTELYGICPEIQVVDSILDDHKSTLFTYAPHHLHYMVSELVKNSCRATIQKYQRQDPDEAKLDKVKIVIVKGAEDVTIKVADRGGGIPRSKMERIWKFAHSTADESEGTTEFGRESATGAPIRGFGLPLARIYARYFGGELTLKSMEGYGLDAYLHLSRLGDACENLPKRVLRSPGQHDSMPSAGTRHFSTQALRMALK